MFRKKLTVEKLILNTDKHTLEVLFKYSKPKNTYLGITVDKPMTEWKFCDVIDLMNLSRLDLVLKVLNRYRKVEEKEIAKSYAPDFIAFSKFLYEELEKIVKLLKQLEKEPDATWSQAGIRKMDRYGVFNYYYSISTNPKDWDAISEVPFNMMYIKLMMDKDASEIQREANRIQAERAKQLKR